MNATIEATEVNASLDSQTCWDAVMGRDIQADGTFVYGVRSTRIYCRPSCPSRRPRQEGAVFFSDPLEAEDEGYRACRRCRPRETSSQISLIQSVCGYIDAHLEEPQSLEDLSQRAALSPAHLQRLFKRVTGISPRDYADAQRMERFRERMGEGDSVTDAMLEAGYSSTSRLYERADSHLGMSPATYGKGGKGANIRYTLTDSPLGRLLVAATDKGVCAVSLGDTDEELVQTLEERYPQADLSREDALLTDWVEPILAHLRGEMPDLRLPLDIQATAFQRKVWTCLMSIPRGETRSYRAVAEELGQPGAVRAVGHACAVNPVALIIPCHRVIREDGNLGGYRWGLDRKQILMDGEESR